jgi:outer membrane protein assembly factor BamB
VLWRTRLATDLHLTGPLAADPSGATYFAYDPSVLGQPGRPSLISIDSCGNVLWRVPWDHRKVDYVRLYLMVSGDRLIAHYGDVQAFDLVTGQHLWTADIAGLIGSSKIFIDTPVAAADGTVYLVAMDVAAPATTTSIVAIDSNGAARVLGPVPNVKDTTFVTDLILDSTGQFDLSLTGGNVFRTGGTPGTINTFRRDGSLAQITAVPNVLPGTSLLAGPGLVLNEASGTSLGPGGEVLGHLGISAVWSAVMDAQSNVFGITQGEGPVVTKFDPAGSVRWKSAPFRGAPNNEPGAGPLLADGAHVFFLADVWDGGSTGRTGVLAAIDTETGAQTTWRFPGGGASDGPLLLTPAAELVFKVGGEVVAVSSGGERPPMDAPWPTCRGGIDQRSAALGQ